MWPKMGGWVPFDLASEEFVNEYNSLFARSFAQINQRVGGSLGEEAKTPQIAKGWYQVAGGLNYYAFVGNGQGQLLTVFLNVQGDEIKRVVASAGLVTLAETNDLE